MSTPPKDASAVGQLVASAMAGSAPPGESLEEQLATVQVGLQNRYYENEYPQVDECVLVQVKSIAEMGAYVTLLEYGNIEGMILLSELSRRRIRSVNKLVRVGKTEVAMVMRVDEQKGYIDLSKRRVTPEDIVRCEERFNKTKAVNGIMRHVAQLSGRTLIEVNQMIAWPLARNPAYKSSYDALRLSLSDPDAVFGPLKADPAVVQLVLSDVKKKLTPQPVKIRADIEVQCFTYEGIEAVRAALMAGLKCGTEQYPIFIKLIAPPLYVMLTSSLEKADGIKSLETAIAAIEEVIRSRGGKLVVKQAPRATSTQEENALASLLEQIEAESRMVDGDDDDDDDDGGISGAAAAGLDRMAGAKGGAAPAGAAGAGAEAGGGDSD